MKFLPDGSLTEQTIVIAAFIGALGVLYVKLVRPASKLIRRGIDLLEAVRDNFLPDDDSPTLPEQVAEIGSDVKRVADSMAAMNVGHAALSDRVGAVETKVEAHDYWIATHDNGGLSE